MTSILKVQNIQYTDGDAALTIADGGGVTLASDLTVDTTTFKVDSSNNRVGVGTASPDTEFHVKGAGTVMNIEGTGGSSFIGLKDSDDGTVGFMGVDGGSIKFQTSGGSYSDKLIINPAGHVTKPSTPYFFGGRSAGQTGSGDFVSNVAQTNTGSHYNTSTGKFTAPVAGRYYCMFGGFTNPDTLATGHYQVSLRVNSSSTKFYYFYRTNNGHTPIHFSDVITLAANDTVCHHIHGSLTVYGTDWTYATQAFYLLG